MNIPVWLIWMVLAAAFIIGEIFTAGFFILWFGIGAAAAGAVALFGLGAGWQLATFVVLSGVLILISRKFAERITKEQPPGIGADRFVGQEGVVLEEIDKNKNTGRIRIGSDVWRAESDEIIKIGMPVKVIKLEGTHAVVKSLKKEE